MFLTLLLALAHADPEILGAHRIQPCGYWRIAPGGIFECVGYPHTRVVADAAETAQELRRLHQIIEALEARVVELEKKAQNP